MDVTNSQLADQLELIVGLVEWDYPIDFAACLVEAANRLRKTPDIQDVQNGT